MPLTNKKVVITLLAYWYNAFIEDSVLHITFLTFSYSQRKLSNGSMLNLLYFIVIADEKDFFS